MEEPLNTNGINFANKFMAEDVGMEVDERIPRNAKLRQILGDSTTEFGEYQRSQICRALEGTLGA